MVSSVLSVCRGFIIVKNVPLYFDFESTKPAYISCLVEENCDVCGCTLSTGQTIFKTCDNFNTKTRRTRKYFICCRLMSSKSGVSHSKMGVFPFLNLLFYGLFFVFRTSAVTYHRLAR